MSEEDLARHQQHAEVFASDAEKEISTLGDFIFTPNLIAIVYKEPQLAIYEIQLKGPVFYARPVADLLQKTLV